MSAPHSSDGTTPVEDAQYRLPSSLQPVVYGWTSSIVVGTAFGDHLFVCGTTPLDDHRLPLVADQAPPMGVKSPTGAAPVVVVVPERRRSSAPAIVVLLSILTVP